jgi:hypothetical protein
MSPPGVFLINCVVCMNKWLTGRELSRTPRRAGETKFRTTDERAAAAGEARGVGSNESWTARSAGRLA